MEEATAFRVEGWEVLGFTRDCAGRLPRKPWYISLLIVIYGLRLWVVGLGLRV